jgi:hypothetical protein
VRRLFSIRTACAAAVVLGLAALAPAAVAVSRPTGDSAAISFFNKQASTYANVPGAKIVMTGYFFVRPGAHKNVRYSWGQPPAKGFVPARATVLAWLNRGKFDAYLVTLTAPRVRPVRILVAGGAVFVSSSRCWNREGSGSAPFGTGERFLFNNGGARFEPLTGTVEQTVVRYSYPWAAGAKATSTDTFATTRKPPTLTSRIAVTGNQRLTIRKSITPLGAAPALPVSRPPARPKPTPICRKN